MLYRHLKVPYIAPAHLSQYCLTQLSHECPIPISMHYVLSSHFCFWKIFTHSTHNFSASSYHLSYDQITFVSCNQSVE